MKLKEKFKYHRDLLADFIDFIVFLALVLTFILLLVGLSPPAHAGGLSFLSKALRIGNQGLSMAGKVRKAIASSNPRDQDNEIHDTRAMALYALESDESALRADRREGHQR